MPDGYCERDDVRRALQKSSFDGAIGQDGDIADDAITGLAQWVRRKTRHHWYDSGGGTTLVPSGPRTVSNIRLDVPASPHTQDRQVFHHHDGIRYPVTRAGNFARIRLPHHDVESIDTLEVRQRDGSFDDWVASSSKASGPGEDYYLETRGDEFRRSYLYLRAGSIGSRVDFTGLLRLGYSYGTDAQDDEWQTVRRSIAMLAAADVVLDEDVTSMVPDNGQLINVQTKAERYVQRALDRGLSTYMDNPI